MQTIWKEELGHFGECEISMPTGSKVLCVQEQNNRPHVWFSVPDISATKEQRIMMVYKTGHTYDKIDGVYVGTVQLANGGYVCHIFEKQKED